MPEHEREFQSLEKSEISSPLLQFFDPLKELIQIVFTDALKERQQ